MLSQYSSLCEEMPDNFNPPVTIPDVFEYNIRCAPTCIPFESEKIEKDIKDKPSKQNGKNKESRKFFNFIAHHNITEKGHKLILPTGGSIEEFSINYLYEQYKKRGLGTKTKKKQQF